MTISGPSSRREFLGGLAAAGAGVFMSGCGAANPAQAPNAGGAELANVRLFDMHHHFASPSWIKKVKADGALNPSWEGYSPAKTVEMMDQAGIDVAFASQSTPGVWLVDGYGNNLLAAADNPRSAKVPTQTVDEARMLVREMNEFGAKMVSDYPGRFGILAALALPDIDGSLRAIEYAFDTLKLQGIGILTSYGNRWIGDPAFAPVFEELNRRKAVVYTHPTAAPCCRDLVAGVPMTTLEFSTDTARTIISWIASGSAKRFPDIRWIHSHGGGTLVASRFLQGDEGSSNLRGTPEPGSRLYYVRQYFYDTNSSNEATLGALKKMMGASQVVWGHFDIPRPRDASGEGMQGIKRLADTEVFTPAELRAIGSENVLRLFPQYASRS
jgi:predicted TIM-barrel fold metal-dependent hydrolase